MKIPLRKYFDILSKYLRNQKLGFFFLAFLILSNIGMQIINPQIIRYFIDKATSGEPLYLLTSAALLFLGVALLQQVISVSAVYLGESIAWNATNSLREDLTTHCLGMDMKFHNDRSPGEFVERIEGDVSEFSNFFSQLVIGVAGNFVLLIGILIVLASINWMLGVIFTIFAVLTVLVLNRVREAAVPYQKAQRDAETELFGFLEEQLSGTEDIRSSGAVDYVLRKLYQMQTVILKRWKKTWMVNLTYINVTTSILLTIGMCTAFYLSHILFKNGALSIGTVYLLLQYYVMISRPIRDLSQQIESMQNIGATVQRMSELLSQQSTIISGDEPFDMEDAPLTLSFNDVSFEYSENKPVLNELSFSLAPGQILGLLGRTGGGKTTIARLIFRLYDPAKGAIMLEDRNIKDIRLQDLRNRVAYVTQDVQLFQASVRDNVTFFNRSVSDDRIKEVIETLGLSEWLAGLPEGLDTRLETGGKSLSAGEGQLLALTRVFLKNPGLVILDEASSRLDPATEQLLERAIDRLLEGRTAIVIAHRLATVNRTDSILILEDGQVCEFGDRMELLKDPSSRFYSLHRTGLEEMLA